MQGMQERVVRTMVHGAISSPPEDVVQLQLIFMHLLLELPLHQRFTLTMYCSCFRIS